MNQDKQKTQLSKFIALILRHKPEEIGIVLDKNGYADVKELIKGINNSGHFINRKMLEEIVETDNKQRYSFDKYGSKIRANQGHSIKVDLNLEPVIPPNTLYHGTTKRFLNGILRDGIKPMSRNHVHLSPDEETAIKVGKRHGAPVVIIINSEKMNKDGVKFYKSENGVWLTDYIDPKYISIS